MKIRIIYLLSYILLYIFSCYVFSFIIYPIFSYEGYNLDINYTKIFFSVLFIMFISLILPLKNNKPSDFLLHVQFIFPIIFMLVLYSAENFSSYYMLCTFFCFIIILGLVKIKFPIQYLKLFTIKWKFFIIIVLLISLLILIILINTHRQFFNLDITKVYEFRFQTKEVEQGFYAYIIHSIFPILINFLLVYSLIYQKNFIKLLAFLLFIILFAFSSHKKYLFLPFFIYGIYLITKTRLPILKIIIGLVGLIIFSIIIDYLWLENLAKSLFIRRFLFVPAQLNFYYYDFFSQNPKIFWSDSKWLLINKIINYPYSLPMTNVIGEEYFNNPEKSANTSWIGSGYAHFGFVGMLIYAIIIGLVLKYLDFKAKTLDKNFIIISFSPFILSVFLSSDLKTVFFSHGLLFYLIIISLLKSKKEVNDKI